MFADALTSQQQANLLRQIDWAATSGDKAIYAIVHDAPTGSDDDRLRVTKIFNSASPCYREIIIKSTLIEAAAFSSRTVRVVAMVKNFTDKKDQPTTFVAMTEAKFETTQDKSPDFDNKARQSVQKSFTDAMKKFIVLQSFH